MQTETLFIPAMGNSAVANHIANSFAAASGIVNIRINTADRRMVVSYDETALTSAGLHELLERTGYQAGKAEESSGCCGGCCGSKRQQA